MKGGIATDLEFVVMVAVEAIFTKTRPVGKLNR